MRLVQPNHHLDPEQLAEKLAPIALQLVDGIRVEDPLRLCQRLLGPLDGWELWGLVCLLAAAVDPHVSPEMLWGWVRLRDMKPRRLSTGPVDPRDLTERQQDELIQQLVDKGVPVRQIEALVGLSATAIARRLERLEAMGRPAGASQ